MKPWTPEPGITSGEGRELAISGVALAELMRAVLEKGAPFRFRARGWSMVPFILDGDVITVAPLPGGLPRMGDVVAFVRRETGKVVVHRIIARRGDAWLTKGDNSSE
ncbi:MAG: S24/S26 family peptidase, partial [Actinobacteria bacterium]|nr:S24/S26 family peptidase [Actinomycetota bacterium]